jgi:hypothetical protein
MMATVVAFLLMAAVPVAAEPAVTNFSADRTTVASGQSITFSVTTTSQTQFVFAMADGVRTQGTRTSGNNWSIIVSPTQSTTIAIFANSSNNETGAARINIPVTVTGVAATPPPVQAPPPVTVPQPPATLGPISIASVTETPATRTNFVQLTVVTGVESSEVWVNFDRVNGARNTGRFARGTLQSQTASSKTWVINFSPTTWAPQRVEVGSNRTYNWPGAATQIFDVTLSQPFTRPSNPAIQSVSVNPRTVSPGNSTTFSIRTNADVENVWIRTVDGVEHNAVRAGSTGTSRNWTVSFNPVRSGNVTIFANSHRSETGATTRTEHINVGSVARAAFVSTPSASWTGNVNVTHANNNLVITATTNEHTNSVWAVVNGNRVQLNRTNSGSGNRTWSVNTWDNWGWNQWNNPNWNPHDPNWWNWGNNFNITVHASSHSGTSASSEDSRTITVSGNWQGNWGWGVQSVIPANHTQNVARGQVTTFTVDTWGTANLWLSSTGDGVNFTASVSAGQPLGNNITRWTVTVTALVGGTAPETVIWLNSNQVQNQNNWIRVVYN